jgi:acetoacetyl-CoA reductase
MAEGNGSRRLKDFVCVAGRRCRLEIARRWSPTRSQVGPIDILVNNAGITRDKFFAKMERASGTR